MLRPIAGLLAICIALAGPATAQEASRRLQELMATAQDFYKAGAYADALRVGQQALELTETEFGRLSERAGIQAYGVAMAAEAAGQLDIAEQAYARVVTIREAVYGTDSPAVAMVLEKRAEMLVKQGRPEAAEPHARRALALRQAVIGPNHAFTAPAHAALGHIAAARANWPQALTAYREAVKLVASQSAAQISAKTVLDREKESHRDTFVGLARAAWQLRGAGSAGSPDALMQEGFTAAQQAWNTAAAGALSRMTARLGAGDTDLGRAVRQLQDRSDRIVALNAEDMALLASWSEVQRKHPAYAQLLEEFRTRSIESSRINAPQIARQRALVEDLQKLLARCPPGQQKAGCERSTAEREAITRELGQLAQATQSGAGDLMALHKRMEAAEKQIPGYDAFTSRRNTLRGEIDALERDVAQQRQQILARYPAYAALAEPGALTVRDVQALLDETEVLLVVLIGGESGFVWAIDRHRATWAQIETTEAKLAADVRRLRAGLDPIVPGGWTQTLEQASEAFDFDLALGIYRRILGPVESMLAGKRHVMLVPTGPLTSLPAHVLVTGPTSGADATERLRTAPWLLRRHAISVLPSVSSLAALRKLAAGGIAVKPFIGIGDPRLDGPGGVQAPRAATARPERYYRNGLADVREVRQLTPLPDTAQEVETVARVLGASPDAVLLGDAATETAVKRKPLRDYRIVHFATHGLVAGDLSGLAEPALVLTPPSAPSEVDDGLLTASEVAALELAADWVVLSACNTAAGDRVGAEALSGLARAFFYAGAKALLVSHWAVYSDAATRLTIDTFSALAAERNLGRAEAFRRAMLKEIELGRPPAYWAPFVIVGDGR